MKEEGEKLSKCMLDALTEHAIKACDMDDNAEDGLISDPLSCSFDAGSVVGDLTSCGSMITTHAAKIYNTMRQGIRSSNGTSVWYGPSHGTPFSAMGEDSKNIGRLWLRHFVLQQPELELPQMTYLTLEEGLTQGKRKYDDIIGTNNPDLSKFRDLGGKILTWHGMADDAIVPQSTFNYKERVNAVMGGADSVDEFYRIFSAPGVGHCYGGTRPLPETAFESLVAWVEEEKAPEHLPATITRDNITIERNLCMYPKTSMYKGTGDIYKASSWTCI